MGTMQQETFICLDCETTGLDPKKDQIIEIAIVKFTLEAFLAEYESLIDPGCPIPQASIDIHNISQEMVVGKPQIATVLPALLQMIGKHTIIGHGIDFDIDIIASAAERLCIPTQLRSNPFIDTLRMARLYGESPTNSLEQLRQHFGIPQEGAHRAMNDVVVNIAVFKYLAQRYKNSEQLLKVLSKPILLKNMPLGKHKGRPMKEVPLPYLKWAVTKDFDQDLMFTLRTELKKRKSGNLFSQAGNPFAGL
jgi:DNA polymerase-3 subunit epsilon